MVAPQDYRALALALVDRVQHDELVARLLKKSYKQQRAGKPVRPVTVADFLAEQRIVAAALASGQYRVKVPASIDAPPAEVSMVLGLIVERAPTFLWSHEMRKLSASYSLPSHTVGPAAFPHRAMWWTFETAVDLGDGREWADGILIYRSSWGEENFAGTMAIASGADGWFVWIIGSTDGSGANAFADLYAVIPDGTPSSALNESTSGLLQMAAILNSKVVTVERKRLVDEHKRWRGRRIGDPSSLNVITLRASVREAVAAERGEGPQWKQRWLVRGHLRAQWYPSLKSHQVIWIAPYLKGPEDAPLKAPIYRVAR